MLTVDKLESFNRSIDAIASAEFDFEFSSYIAEPSDISDDVLYYLASIIDKKLHLDNVDDILSNNIKGPNTFDKLIKSEYIAYVTNQEVPVAVATIIDPRVENELGIIPVEIYEMKSATNLSGYMQQEFFSIADEYADVGIADELRRLLLSKYDAMFTIIDASDKATIAGLEVNGYELVSEFNIQWITTPIQLWKINIQNTEVE